MLLETGLRTFLLATPELTTLIGSGASARLYPVVAPQNAAYPYAVYQRISTVRDRSTTGPTGATFARVQITVHGKPIVEDGDGYAAVRNVAEVIRKYIDGYSGALGDVYAQSVAIENERDEYDPSVRLYTASFDLAVWFTEARPA